MLLVNLNQHQLFIFLLLSIASGFWNLSIVRSFIGEQTLYGLFVLVLVWGVIIPRKKTLNPCLPVLRYEKYIYLIWISVLLSVFSASIYWGQSVVLTVIAQRWLYLLIAGLVLLRVQPTLNDIVVALRWFSVVAILIWLASLKNPRLILRSEASYDLYEYYKETNISGARSYISGINFVLLLFYYECSQLINNYTRRNLIVCTSLVMFFIQYKNRSLLIGVLLAYIYTIFMTGKKKIGITAFVLGFGAVVVFYFSGDLISALINSAQEQLTDLEYDRWRAIKYFVFDYPKSEICYVIGNGFPVGGKSELGNLMWANFSDGIYASDLGLIGMWVDYGSLLLFSVIGLNISIIRSRNTHLSIKLLAGHMLLVPTIFHFWTNPGVMFISLIIYIYALTDSSKCIPSGEDRDVIVVDSRTKG